MDIDYNAVFGLEDTAEEAQESTEVADGTDAEDSPEGSEGAEAQDVADPDEVDGDEADADPEDDSASEGEGQVKSGEGASKQPSENDSAFAAARRKAEAERDRAIAQSAAEMDALVATMGLKHPVTGEAVTTKAQYDEYQKAMSEAETDRQLQRAGLSREALADVVKELPEVKAAAEAASQMTKARLSAEREKQKAAFDRELQAISESDPTVKSVDDLKAKPYFPAMYEKIKAGYTLSDAYRLATYDDHARDVAEKARKQAVASAAGKNHLRPAQSRGTQSVTVPADVLVQYRSFFPNSSDAEISKMYARDLNRKK